MLLVILSEMRERMLISSEKLQLAKLTSYQKYLKKNIEKLNLLVLLTLYALQLIEYMKLSISTFM